MLFKRRKGLCSGCKTGKYTYELDGRSEICPYLYFYKNRKCCRYEPLEKKTSRMESIKNYLRRRLKFD